MSAWARLRVGQVLTHHRRFCRAAVISAGVLLLVTVTMVPHLTSQRRRPGLNGAHARDTFPSSGVSHLNETVAPTIYNILASTAAGGATAKRIDDRVTCQRWKPMDDNEEAVNKLFFSTQKANCSHQKRHEICRIEVQPFVNS